MDEAEIEGGEPPVRAVEEEEEARLHLGSRVEEELLRQPAETRAAGPAGVHVEAMHLVRDRGDIVRDLDPHARLGERLPDLPADILPRRTGEGAQVPVEGGALKVGDDGGQTAHLREPATPQRFEEHGVALPEVLEDDAREIARPGEAVQGAEELLDEGAGVVRAGPHADNAILAERRSAVERPRGENARERLAEAAEETPGDAVEPGLEGTVGDEERRDEEHAASVEDRRVEEGETGGGREFEGAVEVVPLRDVAENGIPLEARDPLDRVHDLVAEGPGFHSGMCRSIAQPGAHETRHCTPPRSRRGGD